jgi:4-hydroxyproline epimerase
MREIEVIDSHTEGEPTRLVIAGGPELGRGSLAERCRIFRERHDGLRAAMIGEPRGHAAIVGALLCAAVDPANAAGVIFFNNESVLGMCGHGLIGLAASLHHMGCIGLGRHSIETPVGLTQVDLIDRHRVRIANVPSYRLMKDVAIDVAGLGRVTGDVSWGGNWFFLTHDAPCALEQRNIAALTQAGNAVKAALAREGITGREGAPVDHVEFFAKAPSGDADSRNFVLCPGGEYDRSPCGTGTSAKLACLAADRALAPGKAWIQESIIGSRFTARYRHGAQGTILPEITGRAYVCAESRLLFDEDDPFVGGLDVERAQAA